MEPETPLRRERRLVASIGLWLGLVLFLLVFVIPTSEESGAIDPRAKTVAAITLLCAVWWITQPIPIPGTSLIPLVLFPALGVLPAIETAKAYSHDLIMLMMGGFFLSQAIQKCALHRRIALRIIAALGRRPEMIILGFMIATGVISMWVSNTTTCLMMLPIALAVLSKVGEAGARDGVSPAAFGTALMLGIAYAASVGGIGTPIGTPANVIFLQQLPEYFPGAKGMITFPKWMAYTLPLVVVLIPLIWLLLTRVLCRMPPGLTLGEPGVLQDEMRRLGPMSKAERRVLVLFAVTACLWIFRADIQIVSPEVTTRDGGEETVSKGLKIPGIVTILCRWKLLPEEVAAKRFIGDGTIAIFMAVLFFLVSSGGPKGERLLDWESASKIPWGLLLLFGGGLAIAQEFQATGLAEWVGGRLQFFKQMPLPLMIGAVCLMMTFLTEVTSNTVITVVMMPVLASLARGIDVNPILLMMPAAISASFAFMLPVATGPNAVVFSSGHVSIARMAKTGFILNLIGVIVVIAYVYLVLVQGLGMETGMPDWAQDR